jgi:probable HAF family extracellular repeat protein
MKNMRIASLLLFSISWLAPGFAQAQAGRDHQTNRNQSLNFLALQNLFTAHPKAPRRSVTALPDAVALGLAKAKVYKFTTLDYPGAAFSSVIDTNVSTALGNFLFDPNNPSSTNFPFTWSGGVYRILTVPGSTLAAATGINTPGQIVGYYVDNAGSAHGFLDDKGTVTSINCPGATGTIVFDINDSGQFAGTYVGTGNDQHGFVDRAGVCIPIDFPGAVNTNATGINSEGDVVGIWEDSALNLHSFLYSAGAGLFTGLDFPFGVTTQAVGINDAGEISGSYFDGISSSHGFIYSDGAFTRIDVVGANGTALGRIRNNGVITGNFTDALSEIHGLKGH